MRSLLWCSVAGCVALEEGDPDVDPLVPPPEPETFREWEALTDIHPDLGFDLELGTAVNEDPLIYAALGEQIGRWNGTLWETITDPVAGLGSFQRVYDTEIYTVVENEIHLWDGVDWFPITDPVDGLLSAFVFLAPTYVFATVEVPGQQPWIELWNGTEWTPFTAELEGLSSFAARGDDLYAVTGGVVQHWDGVSWQAMTAPLPGIGPAIEATSGHSFTVLRGNTVWRWTGVEWYAVSDDPGEPMQPNFQLGPTGLVYAIVGQHVARF